MKIKCPLCCEYCESSDMMYDHLKDSHENMSYLYLTKLIFKIHEKISEHKKLHFNNYIIQQLESLLEDEK